MEKFDNLVNKLTHGSVAREEFYGCINRLKKNFDLELDIQTLNFYGLPIAEDETVILHKDEFRTKDGKGHFRYKKWISRGMVKELLKQNFNSFYLTTGRVLEHYNNAAQTKRSPKLLKRHSEDLLLVSEDDREFFEGREKVVLRSQYGVSKPLSFKITAHLKKGTFFTSFHHAKSNINFLFGDEADELTKTARFKSLKVWVE